MKKDITHIDELIVDAQEGDIDAFSEVYDEFLNSIYRFVFFKVSSETEAEDITSEVFLKAWKNLQKYKKEEGIPFSSWLFRIAHNEVIDFFRRQKPIDELPEEIEEDTPVFDGVRNIENKMERIRLKKALENLPKTQSEVIILKFFSELSNKEIANIIGKTETAVRILQSRGLKTLKNYIKE